MKITQEVFVNFLIKLYKEKNYHNDYVKENKSILNNYLKFLNIDGLISFNEEEIQFKRRNKDFLNIHNKEKENLKDIEVAEKVLNWNINRNLEHIVKDRTIRDKGQMTTFDEMEAIHSELESNKYDFAITTLNNSMIELYKKSIYNSLSILYGFDFSEDIKNQKFWDINVKISKEDEKKLLSNINDFDYI